MSNLPPKPEAVAGVSDRLWEAALDAAAQKNIVYGWEHVALNFHPDCRGAVIDHARCLILLKEVEEPRCPLDEAIEAAYKDCQNKPWISSEKAKEQFTDSIHQHLGPFLKEMK